MATSTPWGLSQDTEKVTRGINFYSTASHGGYKLSKKMNEKVHPAFKREGWAGMAHKGWYEEDCDWAIVVFTFPQYFKSEEYAQAVDTLRRWHSEAWAVVAA